ncbi:hypothetical protein ACN9MU_00045 [Pseudoduganella sp. R-32]|uniref:hypothetical protein n=1 Tax=Pseudoduganella sp. R-32 TaxID=3404061 RepID=UPI003CE8706C
MIRSIHPFPARMAPELALASLASLPAGSVVLDPMSGSGTVMRQAAELGLKPIGFDMDPLAVLMARAWTTRVDDALVEQVGQQIIDQARLMKAKDVRLPWIDKSEETKEFVKYWFGLRQRTPLRKLAHVLSEYSSLDLPAENHAAADLVRIALSRIIVTKEQAASLARDTSHSRPHKVADESNYDVFDGLARSLKQVRKRMLENPPAGRASVELGDARALSGLADASVDAVLTSPPYLNAIDYLRGHRMSLVWLGHPVEKLRNIRSNSIGAERAPDRPGRNEQLDAIRTAMCDVTSLPPRFRPMIDRYSQDLYQMLSEISRVTRPGGIATFVVGNSCLKGTFVQNSAGVAMAASILGFREINSYERDLPAGSRYLPVTQEGALGKRMRTETILTFERTN